MNETDLFVIQIIYQIYLYCIIKSFKLKFFNNKIERCSTENITG